MCIHCLLSGPGDLQESPIFQHLSSASHLLLSIPPLPVALITPSPNPPDAPLAQPLCFSCWMSIIISLSHTHSFINALIHPHTPSSLYASTHNAFLCLCICSSMLLSINHCTHCPLSLHPSQYPSTHPSIYYVSAHPFIQLHILFFYPLIHSLLISWFIYHSIHLPIHAFIHFHHPSINLLIHPSIYPSMHRSLCVCDYLSLYPFYTHPLSLHFCIYPHIHACMHLHSFLYIFTCASIHACIHPPLNPPIYSFSVSLYALPCVHNSSTHLSIHPSFHPSIHPSLHPSISGYIHSSTSPFIPTSLHPSVHLSIYLYLQLKCSELHHVPGVGLAIVAAEMNWH